MRLFPILFYDNDANSGGGSGSNTAEGGQQNTSVSTTVDVTKPLFTEQEIKDFGFDSPDQLKEHLRQHKENNIPDAEKKKQADQEKANFIKYSSDQNLMSVDEITQYESLQKKADRDLVFEKWLPEWKEENPDIDPEEIDRLANDAFDAEFKLKSENEKVKVRGEAKLAKEAKELKSPFESKLNSAKKGYDEFKTMRAEYPGFQKFLSELVTELTPDTLNIAKVKDGETEIDIPVTLTKAERDEISKIFDNTKTFVSYLDSKGKAKETLAPKLKTKITSFLKVKHFDSVAEKSYSVGKGVGQKSGSTAGAENLYGLQNVNTRTETSGNVDVDKEIRENHKQIAQRRF